jgi:hypothetical protein
MNADSVCCPYCNAPVPRDVIVEGSRVRCPRCGEAIPGDWAAPGTTNGTPSPPAPSASIAEFSPGPRRSNRKAAGIILGIMFGMAILGGVFALSTWKLRESRHPKPLVGLGGPRSYEPAELPGLGYLPVDTNVAAGIHVADILRDKLGTKLLESPLPGPLGRALTLVEGRTGVKLETIDHIVLGTTLKDEVPQLTIVVRAPYSLDALRRLYPQKPIPQHKQPLFRVKLEPVGGGYVWCADPRTLVVILRPDAAKIEDMDRIPATPRKGDEGLPEPLRELLEKRLRQSVLWLAGDLNGIPFFDSLNTFVRMPPKELELIKSVRSFCTGMLLQEDLTMIGAVKTRDNQSAREWKDYLEALRWPGVKSKKLLEPPQDGPESRWLNVQIRAEPSTFRDILDELIPPLRAKASGGRKPPD